uniref:Uncharacterized protein n=1 Tax=Tanacetum cinerariifolium TaxID=118510 RepID=A0A6L2L8K7_TANCI|nr:hypothetical protein [Tanacetum cinerariifolium]
MVKPSKGFSLQPNSETTKVLSVSALIIDKEYMSQEKLSSWLERRKISVDKLSQWGPHGTIVQCQTLKNTIAWGKVLFVDQKPSGSVFCLIETCYLRPILDFGTISISNNTSLPIRVLEIPENLKNSVSSSPMTDIQPHIREQMPSSQRHSSGRIQEIQNLNSSYKSNVSGNICGKFPIDKSNMVDSSDMLGGEFLEPGRSTSQVDLHSQVFERVKYAISNETQGVKNKASLIDQEKACQSSTSFLPQQLCSSIQVMQPSQNFHAPNSPSIPSTSFNQNLSLAGDSSLFTKANPQSTSCTLKSKSNKAPECYAICSKALRFSKIVQDKKYISKNKE